MNCAGQTGGPGCRTFCADRSATRLLGVQTGMAQDPHRWHTYGGARPLLRTRDSPAPSDHTHGAPEAETGGARRLVGGASTQKPGTLPLPVTPLCATVQKRPRPAGHQLLSGCCARWPRVQPDQLLLPMYHLLCRYNKINNNRRTPVDSLKMTQIRSHLTCWNPHRHDPGTCQIHLHTFPDGIT